MSRSDESIQMKLTESCKVPRFTSLSFEVSPLRCTFSFSVEGKHKCFMKRQRCRGRRGDEQKHLDHGNNTSDEQSLAAPGAAAAAAEDRGPALHTWLRDSSRIPGEYQETEPSGALQLPVVPRFTPQAGSLGTIINI